MHITHEQLIPPDKAAVMLAAAAVQNIQAMTNQARWLPTLTMMLSVNRKRPA